MLFNSISFLVFFPAIFLVYWVLPKRPQNYLLIAGSYFFYAQWDWRFLSLILISTVVDYFAAIAIENSEAEVKRKRALFISIGTNLSILAAFKYGGFFTENLYALLNSAGISFSKRTLDIVVPVGISFYTFQTLSYTIDVYRRQLRATKDFSEFALFVAFFPQLVAGPIERAAKLLPQMSEERKLTFVRFESGLHLILWGLFKKVFVADNLAAHVVDPILDPVFGPGGLTLVLGLYAFAFQIYCDFSGYSDIAIGCARCLGFDLSKNFDLPYFATSPREFWKGWHISLSTWLGDYLYIPLGGNRNGKTARNLLITMLLGGLWHGAAWHFVAWGFFHGILLGAWRLRDRILGPQRRLPFVVAVIGFFQLTCLGWLLFRAEDMSHAIFMLKSITQNPFHYYDPDLRYLKQFIFFCSPVFISHLIQFNNRNIRVIDRLPWYGRSLVYTVCVYLFILLGEFGAKEFIYFQF